MSNPSNASRSPTGKSIGRLRLLRGRAGCRGVGITRCCAKLPPKLDWEAPSPDLNLLVSDTRIHTARRHRTEHVDDLVFGESLVDQPVLNVDPSGVAASQVPDQLLEPRRCGEGIFRDNGEDRLSAGLKAARGKDLGILLRLLGVDDAPVAHQSSSVEPSCTPAARA